mmetsp:Transcript_21944/g.30502  ORF Transcript_21944/g.30502 Transcript_21944/m.30502 type:complete len:129 (+) Transcript_21944:65-451(+)
MMTDLDKWLSELLTALTEEKFLDFIDSFTEKNCVTFDVGEQRIEHTDIHKQYKRLFESRMESYLRKQSCSMEAFVQLLQERVKQDESCGEFLNILLAVDDYVFFCNMMIKIKSELEEPNEVNDDEMNQ